MLEKRQISKLITTEWCLCIMMVACVVEMLYVHLRYV